MLNMLHSKYECNMFRKVNLCWFYPASHGCLMKKLLCGLLNFAENSLKVSIYTDLYYVQLG